MTHAEHLRYLQILTENPTLTSEEARVEACADWRGWGCEEPAVRREERERAPVNTTRPDGAPCDG